MAQYLLVKRGLYWRPNARGYTGIKAEAGVYSDAESIAYAETDSTDQTYRVLAADADDFSTACSDAERARHWQARAQAAEAELTRLVGPSPSHPREGGDPGQQVTVWRCFHCGDEFTEEHSARLHFGATEDATPACQIKGSEGGLLEALRRAERDAADAWHMIHSETTDFARAYHAQAARHQEQLRAVEQVGYDRGIADAKAYPETLGLVAAVLAPTRTPPAPVAPVELDPVLNAEKN